MFERCLQYLKVSSLDKYKDTATEAFNAVKGATGGGETAPPGGQMMMTQPPNQGNFMPEQSVPQAPQQGGMAPQTAPAGPVAPAASVEQPTGQCKYSTCRRVRVTFEDF